MEHLAYLLKAAILKCILLLILMPVTTTHGQVAKKPLARLSWLLGTWQMKLKKGMLYECWHFVNDSTYQSKGYLVKPTGDTVLQEAIKFISSKGIMYYIPTVKGQNNNQAVPFKITSFKDGGFIGENPEHDFPQRIIYRLDAPKKLYASIEGIYRDKFSKEEYWMQKID